MENWGAESGRMMCGELGGREWLDDVWRIGGQRVVGLCVENWGTESGRMMCGELGGRKW